MSFFAYQYTIGMNNNNTAFQQRLRVRFSCGLLH